MPEQPPHPVGEAWFDGVRMAGAVACVDVRTRPDLLQEPGWWAVVGEFGGRVRAWRFATGERTSRGGGSDAPPPAGPVWTGPRPDAWTSSLDRDAYVAAVGRVRDHIREGDVYQANLCRVLTAPLGGADDEPDPRALAAALRAGNPAPYAGAVHVPLGARGVDPVWVVSASPELYLRIDGGVVTSAPIKGTARTLDGLTEKDRAENVMITDLVRNDLQHVCEPGSVEVTTLLGTEVHPGLVHLVSTVQGRLLGDRVDWGALLDATYPPGSVSGAPKSSALRIIDALEPADRGPYCGTVGWVHVDDDGRTSAELCVAIRSFWWQPEGSAGALRFGTGAGITWGSDAADEWSETELKAARLVGLASTGVLEVGG